MKKLDFTKKLDTKTNFPPFISIFKTSLIVEASLYIGQISKKTQCDNPIFFAQRKCEQIY